MPTFVMRKGELVPIEEAEPLVQVFGTGPAIISDIMPPTRHMADGNYYTSKAQFRQVTKAHGCIEVGNDTSHMNRKPIKLDKKKRVEDIKRAIRELSSNTKRKRKRRA